ncbi:MAG TPA: ABC transporter permease [Gemmatimonadales bacterium]|nr:ABC transporter permease [Gemmatimonadales bacterium]
MSESPWWRISVRNLGRNMRRTVITALGLAFGYFAVVALIGIDDGLVDEMVTNGTGIINGQVQVHAPDYLPDRSVYATIGGDTGINVTALLDSITADPAVTAATPRVFGGGLVSTGSSTMGGTLFGFDPTREPEVARLTASLTAGRLPGPDAHAVVIGSEMARRIHAAVGDTVVVVAPAADGSLGNDLYVVSGIFTTGIADVDAAFALMPIHTLQRLMALAPSRVHEIAIRVPDPWEATAVAARLRQRLAAAGMQVAVRPWTESNPELVQYADLIRAANWVILFVVFGMAIFGVANTMLMATYERRREFALLLVLGAAPRRIVRTVLYEALVLGLVSLVAGAAITVPILIWWHHSPPDLSKIFGSFTLAGALVRPVLKTNFPPLMAAVSGVALLATALAAAVIPAFRAARVPPADTLSGR